MTTTDAAARPLPASAVLWRRMSTGRTGPLTVIVLAIIALWYGFAVYLNAPQLIDRYERQQQSWDAARLIRDAYAMERPILPAPHQVVAELNKTVFQTPGAAWFSIPG